MLHTRSSVIQISKGISWFRITRSMGRTSDSICSPFDAPLERKLWRWCWGSPKALHFFPDWWFSPERELSEDGGEGSVWELERVCSNQLGRLDEQGHNCHFRSMFTKIRTILKQGNLSNFASKTCHFGYWNVLSRFEALAEVKWGNIPGKKGRWVPLWGWHGRPTSYGGCLAYVLWWVLEYGPWRACLQQPVKFGDQQLLCWRLVPYLFALSCPNKARASMEFIFYIAK
jgi:hypothetical protein